MPSHCWPTSLASPNVRRETRCALGGKAEVRQLRQRERTAGQQRYKTTAVGLEALERRYALSAVSRVSDIAPGSWGVFGDSDPTGIVDLNGQPYFIATDARRGYQVWTLDGQMQQARMVTAVNATGTAFGVDRWAGLVNANGTLYFVANDGVHGAELWKSDGSAAGTMMVADLTQGSGDTTIAHLTNVNGTLFFQADGALWKSNGTAGSTVRIDTLNATPGLGKKQPPDFRATPFVVSDNAVYFAVEADPLRSRWDVYRTGGTAGSTIRLAEGLTSFTGLVAAGNQVFFGSWDRVWRTDSTASGTSLIWTNTLPTAFPVRMLAATNGNVYFAAGVGANYDAIFSADGSATVTVRIFR